MNKKIKLQETENCFFIKNIFPHKIVAGFTKTSLLGRLPSDFYKLISYIGKDVKFSYMNQKHSNQIAIIKKAGAYDSDGLFTEQKKHFLIVKTADCLPLFFAKKNSWVGVIHLGWRSAKKGILTKISFNLADFKVVAGVGLRSCCYQVGEEFRECKDLSSYLKVTPKGIFFNPVKFAKEQLVLKGLDKDNFFDLGLCSHCLQGSFFSYRRDKATQRNLSFIGIN